MQQIIDQLNEFNQKGSEVGFNSQEQEAYDHGYIQEYFKNYLPAKLRLLQAIGKAEEKNKTILLNAERIYLYTLFENIWFGYLIAYCNAEIQFCDQGIKSKSYLNHSPSFSSAILHFGTCRDLFFPLLKLLVEPSCVESDINFNEVLDVRYNDSEFLNDLKRFYSGSNRIAGISQDDYEKQGKSFFEKNKFRNIFAHKLRMLWWKNKKQNQELWGFSNIKDNSNYLLMQQYTKKDTELSSVVRNILKSPRDYEEKIEKLDSTNFISSCSILTETHDTIAIFLNSTFGLIQPDVIV